MNLKPGDKAIVTTDGWFYAPDGQSYQGVFGTIKGIYNDEDTLGIKTNHRSANWFLEIGNVTIAGCQIHYAVKTDNYTPKECIREIAHEGKLNLLSAPTRIYVAEE